jgi:hypothetical protein
VYRLTGSSFQLGLVVFIGQVPLLFLSPKPCGCSKPAKTFAYSLAVSLITQRFQFLSATNSLGF